jgi:hypothetical protein
MYTVKNVSNFPVLSRDVSITKFSLAGNNYSPPRRFWLVTSLLGTGKSIIFFTIWNV